MPRLDSQIEWFNNERNARNHKVFFSRFNNLKLKDKRILDFGCGCGALAVDCLLKYDASFVMGVESGMPATPALSKSLTVRCTLVIPP